MYLSIITPSYNPGALIVEAVQSLADAISLVAARHPDVTIEQIILDDGSTDAATKTAYAKIRDRFPFCRIERDALCRQGPASARNRAVTCAKGDWLGFLDADDRTHALGLAALVDTASRHADAQWIIGDTMRFDDSGQEELKRLRCRDLTDGDSPVHVGPDVLIRHMAGPPSLFLGSMIVKTDRFLAAGGFDETLLFGEDWFLTLTLSLECGAYYVPIHVEYLRRAHRSLTQSPMALTSRGFRPTLKAIRDSRFRSVRKGLRWTLRTQIINTRDRCAVAGKDWRALKFGLLAWCVAPEDFRLLGQAIAAAFRKQA